MKTRMRPTTAEIRATVWKQSLQQVLQVPDARQQQTTTSGTTSLPTTRLEHPHMFVLETTHQIFHFGPALPLSNFTRSQTGKCLSTYVPCQKDNFKIMIPYYVCDVKCPILSASRLLDRGYNLKLDTQHCSLSRGDNTPPLLRQRGLFYLAIKRIYIPKDRKLQLDHDGVMRAATCHNTTL